MPQSLFLPTLSTPAELAARRNALLRKIEEYGSQAAFCKAYGLTQSRVSRALDPEKMSDRRLSPIERAIERKAESQEGQRLSRPRRPSITDMLDDPERKRPGAPPPGLARAGGSIVARGFDADGLMYAVEISFYVRPDARETHHGIELVEGPTTPAE